MSFSSIKGNRFNPNAKRIDKLPRKGGRGSARRSGPAAPYAQDAAPPSKESLAKGLESLGIAVSPAQVAKLRSLGGADVLNTIVKLGGGGGAEGGGEVNGGEERGPAGGAASVAAHDSLPTRQTNRKNKDSVHNILKAPKSESQRQVASGDDARDTDRVVTGLQSDRHRHHQARTMARKKVEIRALESLKACGADARAVFRKLQRRNGVGSGSGEVTPAALRQGLQELAGVQLSRADLNAVVQRITTSGGNGSTAHGGGITLGMLSRALASVPQGIHPKTRTEARQAHIDRINLTNKKTLDPTATTLQERRATVAAIDAKVSKRFGTEPDRLRRFYMSLRRNGDGTISKRNLRAGMADLGMSMSDREFNTLMDSVQAVQQSANVVGTGDDVYFSDLVHVFEREPSQQDPPANSIDMRHIAGSVGNPPPATGVLYDGATGLPSHFTHVEHKRGVDPWAETPQPGVRTRPKPHTDEQRRAIRLKQELLGKLAEKGRSVADAFLSLDSDRDGMITQRDMRKGLMMNLGLQLAKDDLTCLVEHAIPPGREGITYQEFASTLKQDDRYHAYMNDKDGSGGGGMLEGPVATVVGIEAAKKWTGRREHRGQLSSAMTARGTVSLGPQYADPHAVGVVGGTPSAAEWAAEVARKNQAGLEARKARKIEETVGEHVRRRTNRLSDTFIDMDMNQHGELSYAELRNGLDRVGVHLSDEDFRIYTRRLDANQNGRIEFEEFARSVKGDVRDDPTPRRMASPPLDKNGNPVRVGMVLTSTLRNYSNQVGQTMQMPPADIDPTALEQKSIETSWVKEQERVLGEGSSKGGQHGPGSSSIESLGHVATRLKVRDTLNQKVRGTVRDQYLAMRRGADGKLNAASLHASLKDKGADVSPAEVADLLVTAGVASSLEDASTRKIGFNDFKKLVHLSGLGDDVRAYDFARAVQIAPAVGHSAGAVKVPEHPTSMQDAQAKIDGHKAKHLSQAAGGKRAQTVPLNQPTKRVTRNKNAESGAVGGIVGPNTLSVVDEGSPGTVMHDVGAHFIHSAKHVNVKYRQHDHIREMGLLGGGVHASMGHEGVSISGVTAIKGRHNGQRRHIGAAGHSHAQHDHLSEQHLMESPDKLRYEPNKASPDNLLSPSARRKKRGVTPKPTSASTPNKEVPRHLQSAVRIDHDHGPGARKGRRTSVKVTVPPSLQRMIDSKVSSDRGRRRASSNAHPDRGTKILRLGFRPPASPAALAAVERKTTAKLYDGAAGVTTDAHDRSMMPGHHGRTHNPARYQDSGLFSNMQYPGSR